MPLGTTECMDKVTVENMFDAAKKLASKHIKMVVSPQHSNRINIKVISMAFDKELLEILVCPKCKGELELTPEEDGLNCNECKLKYLITDSIPIMLIDQAQPLP